MKYLVIIGDGMSDRPIKSLGDRTPLMVAEKPSIDLLCSRGRCGRYISVPESMPPGSEVANLAVLGYDVEKVYSGRGVLEAAAIGVNLKPDDLALRCNLITIDNGRIINHSAGHITTEDAAVLLDTLKSEIQTENIRFHKGFSYRHLLVLRKGSDKIVCTPPHDVPGTPFRDVMVAPSSPEGVETAELLNDLIIRSQAVLKDHPYNIGRKRTKKPTADSIWPWSPGRRPQMKTLKQLYGLSGAVISAVDLIKGIGVYAGMEVINVPGATGLHDTNYEGKAKAAMEALRRHDFVYLHVEATDEAAHEGNIDLKIKTIEYLDSRIVKYVMGAADDIDDKLTIALLPDHATPCEVRTHVHDPVPVIIYNPDLPADGVTSYDEFSVDYGSLGTLHSNRFIKILLKSPSPV